MADEIVVLVTASDKQEAQMLGREVVKQRLAACANIVEGVQSLFWWQGAIADENEALMLLKSTRERFPRLVERLKTLHSYETPEIIAIPIMAGSEEYLAWLREETSGVGA